MLKTIKTLKNPTTHHWIISVMLAGIILTPPSRAEPPSIPELNIPVCDKPPVLDGILDDACWQTAAVVERFYVLGSKNEQMDWHVARIVRDDKWLYIAFDINHPSPQSIEADPELIERGGRIQNVDCIKIGFDPGTDGALWYHLRLSAGNARTEQRNTGGGEYEQGWQMPWRSATRVTDNGWQAEIALPFSELLSNGNPAKARINLLVHTYLPEEEDPNKTHIIKKRHVAAWSWSKRAWWEYPARFARLHGLDKAELKAPFLPFIDQAEISGYALTDGDQYYTVNITLSARSGEGGAVDLVVRDETDEIPDGEIVRRLELIGGSSDSVAINVPAGEARQRTPTVQLRDITTGEILHKIKITDTSALDVFSVWLDRNYYTSETTAKAYCRIGLPSAMIAGNKVIVKDAEGHSLAQVDAIEGEFSFSIPIHALNPACHVLSIQHVRSNGDMVAQLAVDLKKKHPKPGHEWKIDRVNRILIKDDEPFLPFGVVFSSRDPEGLIAIERNFEEIRGMGFNSIIYWFSRPTLNIPEAAAMLDLADKNDLFVVIKPEAFLSTTLTLTYRRNHPPFIKSSAANRDNSDLFAELTAENIPIYRDVVRVVKDHPRLMAYYTFDEPGDWQNVGGQMLYEMIREEDGYKPCWQVWNRQPPVGNEFTSWADIIARDIYWTPPARGVNWSPARLAKLTALLDRRAAQERKPCWVMAVGEAYGTTRKRPLIGAEQICQTYMALIHGAKGIFYFIYPFNHRHIHDAMRELSKQINVMKPALLASEPDQTVRYTPNDFDPERDQVPDVNVALFRYPSGEYLLLAANWRMYPVDTEIMISCLPETGSIRSLFSEETFNTHTRRFTHRFDALAAYAFIFNTSATNDGHNAVNQPVDIHVQLTPLPDTDLPGEEPLIPITGRTESKNLIPNPSFEDAFIPGVPDYWKGRGNIHLAEDNPWHGNVSLKIIADPDRQHRISNQIVPEVTRVSEYVFSAYMRAERDGMRIRMTIGNVPDKSDDFTLTTEWRRYSVRIRFTPEDRQRYSRSSFMFILKPQESGAVWIDAVQLEHGLEATEFEP